MINTISQYIPKSSKKGGVSIALMTLLSGCNITIETDIPEEEQAYTSTINILNGEQRGVDLYAHSDDSNYEYYVGTSDRRGNTNIKTTNLPSDNNSNIYFSYQYKNRYDVDGDIKTHFYSPILPGYKVRQYITKGEKMYINPTTSLIYYIQTRTNYNIYDILEYIGDVNDDGAISMKDVFQVPYTYTNSIMNLDPNRDGYTIGNNLKFEDYEGLDSDLKCFYY